MERTARCACEQLSVVVEDAPDWVAACSCQQCQRRTGTVVSVSAYFPVAAVKDIRGNSQLFTRNSDAGRALRAHFCPNCGSSVYWEADFCPGHVGIGVGMFNDDDFPPPQVAVWTQHLPDWMSLPEGIRTFEAGPKR